MKDEWSDKLTAEQKRVLIDKGTEPPFSGTLLDNEVAGMYCCAACHTPLFSSKTKFDSGSGWPSFWNAAEKSNLKLTRDMSFGMDRTEVSCATCGGHLGHLFDYDKTPTGDYYCINSVSLDFKEGSNE